MLSRPSPTPSTGTRGVRRDRGYDQPTTRLYNYNGPAFPYEQFDPEEVITTSIDVLTGKDAMYRHVLPVNSVEDVRAQLDVEWSRTLTDGTRPELVQTAYDIDPYTPVADTPAAE